MHSDARKSPWHLDVPASAMETCIAALPLLLRVAKLARSVEDTASFDALDAAVEELTLHFPGWSDWLQLTQSTALTTPGEVVPG